MIEMRIHGGQTGGNILANYTGDTSWMSGYAGNFECTLFPSPEQIRQIVDVLLRFHPDKRRAAVARDVLCGVYDKDGLHSVEDVNSIAERLHAEETQERFNRIADIKEQIKAGTYDDMSPIKVAVTANGLSVEMKKKG